MAEMIGTSVDTLDQQLPGGFASVISELDAPGLPVRTGLADAIDGDDIMSELGERVLGKRVRIVIAEWSRLPQHQVTVGVHQQREVIRVMVVVRPVPGLEDQPVGVLDFP
nr:hypothetical protein [Kocuria sp. KRD140]